MNFSRSLPLLIGTDDQSVFLERVSLSGPKSKGLYSEKWVQNLLYCHPEALPVDEIDAAYAEPSIHVIRPFEERL